VLSNGDARPISWMRSLSAGRLARQRWLSASPLSTAVSLTQGPMVRIRLPLAKSRANFRFLSIARSTRANNLLRAPRRVGTARALKRAVTLLKPGDVMAPRLSRDRAPRRAGTGRDDPAVRALPGRPTIACRPVPTTGAPPLRHRPHRIRRA